MKKILLAFLFVFSSIYSVHSHEAWILTHSEVVNLSHKKNPEIFTSELILFPLFLISYLFIFFLLYFEKIILKYEEVFFLRIKYFYKTIGPAILRCGIALNIGLGAIGFLPRHGVEQWKSPTLFVPDMQLNLVSGNWEWLTIACVIVSISLFFGFLSRIMSFLIIVLSVFTSFLFGEKFILYYAFHFIAPALIIMYYGGGVLALDNLFKTDIKNILILSEDNFWKLIQLMTGLTFVALAVGVKLLQPTLIIAILDHAEISFFGIPTPVAALIMMLVELIAGLLLALGYWVRPIAAFLIGAFTFFAIILGETPLFHANLYALMFVFLLRGGSKILILELFQKIHFPKWTHKNA